ncbi:MAG TPA: hypothetical protein VEG33_05420 [Streptosporangiaceae bacterium]|nr:hypothetical protein [Streptosporangiaceae bacterium]
MLDDRVRRLQRDLEAADHAINAVPQALRARLTGGLRNEIARKSDTVNLVLSEPLRDHALHPADAWARMHAMEIEIAALLEESLALAAGASFRSSSLAGPSLEPDGAKEGPRWDVCSIADALIDELVARTPVAGWASFTVFGGAEFFRYTSRLIQIRFPRPTSWDLPGTAHELGHYVARTLEEFHGGRMRNLVDELHDELDATDVVSWHWLEELFADAFGAWVLGPAYGLTCVTLAFDPLEANIGTASHPAGSARVHTITTTLEAFNDDGVGSLAGEIAQLWARLAEVCEAEPVPAGEHLVPEPWSKKIADLLAGHLPHSRYSTFSEAELLSSDLSQLGADTTLADVLNAAWLARIGAASRIAVDETNQRALTLAKKIAVRGNQ